MRKHPRPAPAPFGKPRLVQDDAEALTSPLGRATTKRLQNQLARAFQHGFGAEQGLRVLVNLATKQMLSSGTPRETIHATLQDIINDHPASTASRSRVVDGQTRTEALTTMILKWSDRAVAGEPGHD